MPRADFYAGLALAEQLEKLADHHHDPQVRHISADEAALLYEAVERLRSRRNPAQELEEFEAIWRRLGQIYSTTILSSRTQLRLQVFSIPSSVEAAAREDLFEAVQLTQLTTGPASPRTVQIALNAMLLAERDESLDVVTAWSLATARRSPPADRSIGEPENELLNRAIYQPTVAVEKSPPAFRSLVSVLENDVDSLISLATDTFSGAPVTIITTGVGVLVLRILGPAARGVGRGLEERMYRWAKPKDDERGQRSP